MREINYIIVHCSAVRPNQTSSSKQIDEWHKARGWKMIGYHYVVRRDGSIEQGRPETMVGAHCKGYNTHSIGVCYEGGLGAPPSALPQRGGNRQQAVEYIPMDTRTPEQKTALLRLLSELKQRFPDAKIVGHHDLNHNKSCPCFDARAEYSKL